MKTLHDNCRRLGYTVSTQKSYSGQNMDHARRYLLIDKLHKVALNSVPKTGSTTWRFVLHNSSKLPNFQGFKQIKHGQKLSAIHGGNAFKNTYTTPAKHMENSEVLKSLKTYYTVLTVRHPFDRLESTFMDKVVLHNLYSIRERILRKRNINEDKVKALAQDGKNVKFEEFLQHVTTAREAHWSSIFQQTSPCSLPYR